MGIRLTALSAYLTVLLLGKVHCELSTPVYEKTVQDGNAATISCAPRDNNLKVEIIDADYDGVGPHCTDLSVKNALARDCDETAGCSIRARDPSQTRGCQSRPLKVRYTCSDPSERT